jgi:hypothetical protein
MIDARQLRIDNWVLRLGDSHQWESTDFTTDPELFDPIPLTPELLEKIGFSERQHLHDWYRVVQEQTILTIHAGEWLLCPSNSAPCLSGEVRYLHQIQNLFYTLTGEELNIQL